MSQQKKSLEENLNRVENNNTVSALWLFPAEKKNPLSFLILPQFENFTSPSLKTYRPPAFLSLVWESTVFVKDSTDTCGVLSHPFILFAVFFFFFNCVWFNFDPLTCYGMINVQMSGGCFIVCGISVALCGEE